LILELKLSSFFNPLWIIIILYCNPLLSFSNPESIHIFYTTNLNSIFNDCQCGGDTVGGFVRVVTIIKQMRETYPDMVLLDAGDFFNSYPLAKQNKKMIHLMAYADYDYANLGDQEFVDGEKYLFREREKISGKFKLLSGNLTSNRNREYRYEKTGMINRDNLEISISGMIHPTAFDFIKTEGIQVLSPDMEMKNLESLMNQSDFQIVLFHGFWKDAELLAKSFPWIDLVIISHSKEMKFKILNKTALVEAGAEGRYVGQLEVSFVDNNWRFTNNFIPVTKSVVMNEEALKIINQMP
jgi:5'-nucleotidase